MSTFIPTSTVTRAHTAIPAAPVADPATHRGGEPRAADVRAARRLRPMGPDRGGRVPLGVPDQLPAGARRWVPAPAAMDPPGGAAVPGGRPHRVRPPEPAARASSSALGADDPGGTGPPARRALRQKGLGAPLPLAASGPVLEPGAGPEHPARLRQRPSPARGRSRGGGDPSCLTDRLCTQPTPRPEPRSPQPGARRRRCEAPPARGRW